MRAVDLCQAWAEGRRAPTLLPALQSNTGLLSVCGCGASWRPTSHTALTKSPYLSRSTLAIQEAPSMRLQACRKLPNRRKPLSRLVLEGKRRTKPVSPPREYWMSTWGITTSWSAWPFAMIIWAHVLSTGRSAHDSTDNERAAYRSSRRAILSPVPAENA